MSALAPLLVGAAVVGAAWAVRPLPVRRPGASQPARRAAVDPPTWFVRRARSADLAPVGRWWLVARVLPLACGLAGGVLAGPVAAVVGAGLGAGGVLVGLRLAAGRADDRLARAVPDALDAVARRCRAGSSVPAALGSLGPGDGPAGPVFATVARRVHHGVALATALDEVVASHPAPAVRLAATALLVGADTGAAPARAVEGVAATLRDRAALEREAAAQATQATASAAVLLVAPVGFGIVAVTTDPRVGAFLFGSPVGWWCLGSGVVLDALGAWWMLAMVRSAR